jgi:hypothetical protein
VPGTKQIDLRQSGAQSDHTASVYVGHVGERHADMATAHTPPSRARHQAYASCFLELKAQLDVIDTNPGKRELAFPLQIIGYAARKYSWCRPPSTGLPQISMPSGKRCRDFT